MKDTSVCVFVVVVVFFFRWKIRLSPWLWQIVLKYFCFNVQDLIALVNLRKSQIKIRPPILKIVIFGFLHFLFYDKFESKIKRDFFPSETEYVLNLVNAQLNDDLMQSHNIRSKSIFNCECFFPSKYIQMPLVLWPKSPWFMTKITIIFNVIELLHILNLVGWINFLVICNHERFTTYRLICIIIRLYRFHINDFRSRE